MKQKKHSTLDEKLYRVLIDNAPEAVVVFDFDKDKFVDCNENALDFFKLSKEELLTKGPIELSPEIVNGYYSKSHVKQYLDAALNGGNPFFEWIYLDSNGLEKPCEVRIVRLPPHDQKLLRTSIIDKSGEKQIESALKESQERLSLALNATGLGTFDLFPFENKLIWDERMHQICGLPLDSDADRNEYFFSLVHPEDIERVQQSYISLMDPQNAATTFEDSYRIIRHEEVVHISTKGFLIRDDNGNVVRSIGTCQDVTAQKEAEEQLSFQAALLENISDAVIVTDNEFKIKSWNRAACEMYGWNAEEILDKSIKDIIPTTYIDCEGDDVLEEFLEKGLWKGEVIQKTSVGEDLYILASVTQIKAPDGTVIGSIGVNRNITDRKKAEEALRKSEEHYRRLVEKSHDLIWEVDMEGVITYINGVAKEFYGYEPHELKGWNFSKLVAPHSLEKAMMSFQNVITSGQGAVNIENELLHKDGSTVILDSRVTAIRDQEGNITGMMGTSQNITERKLAEEKLSEINNRLHLSTKAAKIGIWDWNIEQGKLFWDETMKEFYGLPKNYDQLSYDLWINAIHPDDLEKVQKTVVESMKEGGQFDYEFRIILPDKTIRYIKALGITYINDFGEPSRILGINWDNTKEKEAEREKIRASSLEQKNKELQQFAYIASHEMQEPLRTIKGLSDVLVKRHGQNLDERGQEYLSLINQASSRMSDQIKALLKYSRIGHSKKKKEIDCNELVISILNDLTKQISDTSAQVEANVLPVLYGNKSELRVLFQNLISNAIKFRKKETISIVEISSKNLGDYWQFSISDNGIGVDQEYLETIFALFHRINSKEYEGSGIGLAHCQKIVDLHGGKIWVESEIDKGSTFYFTIPT